MTVRTLQKAGEVRTQGRVVRLLVARADEDGVVAVAHRLGFNVFDSPLEEVVVLANDQRAGHMNDLPGVPIVARQLRGPAGHVNAGLRESEAAGKHALLIVADKEQPTRSVADD